MNKKKQNNKVSKQQRGSINDVRRLIENVELLFNGSKYEPVTNVTKRRLEVNVWVKKNLLLLASIYNKNLDVVIGDVGGLKRFGREVFNSSFKSYFKFKNKPALLRVEIPKKQEWLIFLNDLAYYQYKYSIFEMKVLLGEIKVQGNRKFDFGATQVYYRLRRGIIDFINKELIQE